MTRSRRTDLRRGSERAGQPSKARLDALVEEATVDAYGDTEQIAGLFTKIEEHLRVPFEANVLGIKVVVERVDLNDAREIMAVCRAGNRTQRIPILDLPLPMPTPEGAERIAAYRHWL